MAGTLGRIHVSSMIAAQLNVPVSDGSSLSVALATVHDMHLVVNVDGRRIAYMPADQADRFVQGETTLLAVPEADPGYVRPSELRAGLKQPAS